MLFNSVSSSAEQGGVLRSLLCLCINEINLQSRPEKFSHDLCHSKRKTKAELVYSQYQRHQRSRNK